MLGDTQLPSPTTVPPWPPHGPKGVQSVLGGMDIGKRSMQILEVDWEFQGLGHLEHGLEGRGKLWVGMFLDVAVTSLMVSSHPVFFLTIRENFLKVQITAFYTLA